jgi:hypothetical protein
MVRSRRFCTRLPRHTYIDPLSGSAAKTLILTLQGVQALYAVSASARSSNYARDTYLGNVFLPLAIFGLLRLPAALWMSDDAAYANEEMMLVCQMQAARSERDSENGTTQSQELLDASMFVSTMPLPIEPQDDPPPIRFRPPNGPHGIAVRAFYLLSILPLTGFTAYSAIPPPKRPRPPIILSATLFTQILFFLFFLLATSCIVCFYFLRGNSTLSIIPCLRSNWYRLYTAVLFLGMLLLIVFGAIETRQQWCGQWTTYPNDVSCPSPPVAIQVSRIQMRPELVWIGW